MKQGKYASKYYTFDGLCMYLNKWAISGQQIHDLSPLVLKTGLVISNQTVLIQIFYFKECLNEISSSVLNRNSSEKKKAKILYSFFAKYFVTLPTQNKSCEKINHHEI